MILEFTKPEKPSFLATSPRYLLNAFNRLQSTKLSKKSQLFLIYFNKLNIFINIIIKINILNIFNFIDKIF